MSETTLPKELVDALRCLPGVGARTAQRMAFHLLENDRRSGERLAKVMARQKELLCAVEHPSDVVAKRNIPASRIAHGVPMGSELEYVDSGTLSHAFEGRRKY